jgi:phytanoyl-CoA hydroxylase
MSAAEAPIPLLDERAHAIDLPRVLGDLARDGYARVGRVASDAILDALRARADDIMLGKVAYPGLFFQLDTETGNYDDLAYGKGWEGPSLNYRKIEKLEKDAIYSAWINNPFFEAIARARIAGDVAIYRAILMSKRARGGTVLPWHQDGGRFWGLDRDPELQVWTALDDAPEDAGCLEVFPRSHVEGLVTPLGGVVPPNHVAARDPERAKVSLPARAGEVILIHNYVWHRSGVNTTDKPRRGFSVCYMSALTKCMRKKREPRIFQRVFTRDADLERSRQALPQNGLNQG